MTRLTQRTCGCALLGALALPLALCGFGALATWLGQPLIPALPPGYATEMCVAVATAGWDFISVEVHWEPPGRFLNRPWAPKVCGYLPWSPVLRSSGKQIYFVHTR